jgi:hypothetical protein
LIRALGAAPILFGRFGDIGRVDGVFRHRHQGGEPSSRLRVFA